VQALMPGTPEARLAAGYVAYLCRHHWGEALAEFRAARAGQPNLLDPVRYESFALRRLGRIIEAIGALERSLEMDPHDMLGWDSLIESQFFARRYTEIVRSADAMAARGLFSDTTAAIRAYAQLAMDGDLARYRLESAPMRSSLARGFLPDLGWRGDLMARDFAGAEAYLAESGGFISGINGVLNNPIAQVRAVVAFAQGDQARAQALAVEARRHYESRTWMRRQQSSVAAEFALAHALAGDPAKAREALVRSRDFLQTLPDALVECGLRYLWAVTHTVLGEREAALSELRVAVGGFNLIQLVPSLAHLDPTWDSLKNDPRFAEIMKSAKVF
jgi:tetratricopeptide (TPR) repeat protein